MGQIRRSPPMPRHIGLLLIAASWLNRTMALETPIVIATFGSLVRHGYRMEVHCWRCERSVTIDAAVFLAELSQAGRRFRCSCGERSCPTISKPLAAQESTWADNQ